MSGIRKNGNSICWSNHNIIKKEVMAVTRVVIVATRDAIEERDAIVVEIDVLLVFTIEKY